MKNLKFNIEVISKNPEKIWGIASVWGEITVGNFKEKFIMSLDSWTLDDYRQQWVEGAERIKTHNTSCFVVLAQNLKMNKNMHTLIETWTIYKDGETVFFHNNLFNRAMVLRLNLFNFNVKVACQLVDSYKRKVVTNNGEKVSEWSCHINEIYIWLENIKKLSSNINS